MGFWLENLGTTKPKVYSLGYDVLIKLLKYQYRINRIFLLT